MNLPDRIVVQVIAEDITSGVRWNADRCPVALALHRNGYEGATVGVVSAAIPTEPCGETTATYRLSKRGEKFVEAFDAQKLAEPCRFVLTRLR